MKTKFLSVTLASMALATTTQATVTAVGVDTTAGANWRTAASLEGDNEYGTSGYAIYGIDEADGVYTSPFNTTRSTVASQFDLPGAITNITAPFAAMWSGNGNFGQIEDPSDSNNLTNTSLLAGVADGSIFTISRVPTASFRMTILVASGDGAGVTYTSSVDDGSGAVAVTPEAHSADGLFYHVYDISAGSDDIVITMGANNNFSVTGFAFDNVLPDVLTIGDTNIDGVVDLVDYVALRDNFGSGTSLAQGDVDNDGDVDHDDFWIIRTEFPKHNGGASLASAIPEPTSFALVGLGGLAMLRRSKK